VPGGTINAPLAAHAFSALARDAGRGVGVPWRARAVGLRRLGPCTLGDTWLLYGYGQPTRLPVQQGNRPRAARRCTALALLSGNWLPRLNGRRSWGLLKNARICPSRAMRSVQIMIPVQAVRRWRSGRCRAQSGALPALLTLSSLGRGRRHSPSDARGARSHAAVQQQLAAAARDAEPRVDKGHLTRGGAAAAGGRSA
jgi:hypothetical protein